MKWQPIDTAPKDGTWVLLTGGKVFESDYERMESSTENPAVVAFWCTDDLGFEFWCYAFWDSAWRSAYKNPTHWMYIHNPKM